MCSLYLFFIRKFYEKEWWHHGAQICFFLLFTKEYSPQEKNAKALASDRNAIDERPLCEIQFPLYSNVTGCPCRFLSFSDTEKAQIYITPFPTPTRPYFPCADVKIMTGESSLVLRDIGRLMRLFVCLQFPALRAAITVRAAGNLPLRKLDF